jgi:glycine/D-amino acid oxidase-like deaminating enzyme
MPKVDVAIAGGGAVGSAIAYFLTESSGFTGSVAVGVARQPLRHSQHVFWRGQGQAGC